MARKSGFVRWNGRQRRESLWIFLTEAATTMASANTAVLVLSLNAAALALRPFTIVRTRMDWFLRSDQTAALEAYQTALGLAVVSDQAVGIGVTAIPTPFTDMGSDLWFTHEIQSSVFAFISGVGFQSDAGVNRVVDSKAMRKVEDGEDIIMALENSSLSDGT